MGKSCGEKLGHEQEVNYCQKQKGFGPLISDERPLWAFKWMFLMGTPDRKSLPLRFFALFYMELKIGLVNSYINVSQVQVEKKKICYSSRL